MADNGDQVYLNIYDANVTFNSFLSFVGLGFYHTCVQVYGRKYMYTAGEGGQSGIVSGDHDNFPWCEGLHLRATIAIGRCLLGPDDVHLAIEILEGQYTQNSYTIFTRNCNHFSDSLCRQLTGNGIPRWVNRIAGIGVFCGCMLPVGEVNAEVWRIAHIGGDHHEMPVPAVVMPGVNGEA